MCGAPAQVTDLNGLDVGTESVVQGTIVKAGSPVAGAYVRLLDATGEFTAEVQSSATGMFRFYAAPGDWTVRALTRGRTTEARVAAVQGKAVGVTIDIPA
jgi:hypothetical protein